MWKAVELSSAHVIIPSGTRRTHIVCVRGVSGANEHLAQWKTILKFPETAKGDTGRVRRTRRPVLLETKSLRPRRDCQLRRRVRVSAQPERLSCAAFESIDYAEIVNCEDEHVFPPNRREYHARLLKGVAGAECGTCSAIPPRQQERQGAAGADRAVLLRHPCLHSSRRVKQSQKICFLLPPGDHGS